MNEMSPRFQELWKQCKTTGVHPEFGEYVAWNKQKFAELIVKECMRMCDVAEHAYITHGLDVPIQGCRTAKEYIADWFEVEE